jgi:endonuclease III
VLHRYREKLPGWLVAAARIVVDEYAGDAARIWNDHPTARQLQQRLDRFPGIGQKKAAMAVEILDRDLGVSIRELDDSDIAYDVHVRRVLLRTGLADYDDLDHMIDVARRAYPNGPARSTCPPG